MDRNYKFYDLSVSLLYSNGNGNGNEFIYSIHIGLIIRVREVLNRVFQ